jgi:uncharacterized protein
MSAAELVRALLGGALIGVAATVYWRANGRVAGISGILRGALLSKGDRPASISFLIGLAMAGLAGLTMTRAPAAGAGGLPLMGLAGLLVGLGTRIGGGCTSGHGVCGLSRVSRRSLVATLTFIATGVLTVLVVSRWLRALGGP